MKNAKAAQEDQKTLRPAYGCQSVGAVSGRTDNWRAPRVESAPSSHLSVYGCNRHERREDWRQATFGDNDSAGAQRNSAEGGPQALGERTETASQKALARLLLVRLDCACELKGALR